MDGDVSSILAWFFGVAGIGYALLASYLTSLGEKWREGKRARMMLLATTLGALWAGLTFFSLAAKSPSLLVLSAISEIALYGAWYAFLYQLLSPEHGNSIDTAALPAWLLPASAITIIGGIALHIALVLGAINGPDWARIFYFYGLAKPVLGLILLEQLFRNVADDVRWNIKPLCLALAGQMMFDIYLYSDALMFQHIDADAATAKGLVHAITVPLLFIASLRGRDWTSKIRLSQRAAFHSATLLAAGLYLLLMSAVGYYVRYFGGEWGRAFQYALIFTGLLALGILLVSGSMRAKIRVLIGKHFFAYRYDYREEWLRFTQTLAAQDNPQAMGEQVIRGLANMVESPAGSLWLHDHARDSYRQTARWNLPENDSTLDCQTPLIAFLMESGWVVNLEEFRAYPGRYGTLEIPRWVSEIPEAWLIIPLMVGSELQGFVILASARTQIDVNWEVNDLLRTAGCQAASFLAKMQATEALLEARKFDAFNRMSAFVVHDLKNIVTQLALMLKNAERHRHNPEFQDDMLMTVAHSVERMRQLMMQLREGATPPGSPVGVNLSDVIEQVQSEKARQGRQVDVRISAPLVTRGHRERLERVIGHLVQNALDATLATGSVWVQLEHRGDRAYLVVGDTGHGMTPEFIRDRLFKPFQTTKDAGMGIGAYESAQYIRELGGELQVDSTPGEGTQMTLVLPLIEMRQQSDLHPQEAA